MAEPDTVEPPQPLDNAQPADRRPRPTKPPASPWAVRSLIVAWVAPLPLLVLVWAIGLGDRCAVALVSVGLAVITALPIAAAVQIGRSNGRYGGRGFTIVAVCVSVVWWILFVLALAILHDLPS